MRWLWRGALTLVVAIVLYLLAAGAGALIPGPVTVSEDDSTDHRILLAAGPIHYDFLIPLTPETRADFAALAAYGLQVDDPREQWLIIGWGAREFYTTTGGYSDLSLPTLWRSFTGDAAVLRVDTVGALRSDLDLPGFDLSASQFTRFRMAIRASFRTDEDGRLRAVSSAGFGASDRFFEAHGRFDILRTCNTWVSQMIRAAGLRFGIWTPTPYAVTLSLKHYHAN